MTKKRYFVTATGTDIGKSFITAGLVRQAKARGQTIMAYKPLLSGYDDLNPHTSDTGALLRAMDMAINPRNIDRITPWRYHAPLAPSMAARLENRPVDFDALTGFCRHALAGPEDCIVVEGVGGLMVPLNDCKTVADWIEALRIPSLLVTGTYLGSISHALTAIEVMRQRRLPIDALIVNESAEFSVSITDTAEELRRFCDLPILSVTRRGLGDENPLDELDALLR